MWPQRASLALKLNLALLAFFLVLGAATLTIVLYGFNRTQDNADARSNEALEQGGSLALQAVAGGAAEQGGLLFEAVAEIGQRASIYVETRAQVDSGELPPAVEFATSETGHRYDANAGRVADLVVINGVSVDDEPVQDDIVFSAALEDIFPALLQGFDGQVGGRNLDPIAIVYISTNGVTRYYPPVGIHSRLPSDADFTERMTDIGPERNPERRTIWTAPYEDGAGQGLIVTARTPVYDGQSFRGSIEVDVSMSNVFAQIDGIRPTPRAFAFYVDKGGTLLEGRSFPLLNTEAGANQEFSQVLDAMRSVSPDDSTIADARLPLAGENYYIAYGPVPVLGGTFAVAAPVSDLTAAAASISSGIDDEATRTLRVMLAAMAVLFAFGLVGAGILNRRVVVQPLQRLAAGTRAVASGDLTAQVPAGRQDEIGELGAGFNVMVDQLRESERMLEQRVEDRTRELNALLDVSRSIASTLELDRLLDLVLEQTSVVLPNDRSTIMLREGDVLHMKAVRVEGGGEDERLRRQVGMQFPIASTPVLWGYLHDGTPLRIDDTLGEDPAAIAYRDEVVQATGAPVPEFRSWVGIPLMRKSELIGLMTIARQEPASYGQREEEIGAAIASQIAVAVENARLFEGAQHQARDMEALSRADAELFQTLNLDRVLQALVDVAVDVLGVDKSVVMLHEGDVDVIQASRNFSPENIAAFNKVLATMPHEEPPPAGQQTVVYADISEAPAFIGDMLGKEQVKSHMSVPVRDAERTLGVFGVSYRKEHAFTDDEQRLYGALADRAAVAIKNAELYERAQQVASLEERQRLARELHDSVSQALYGIALGARTAKLRLGDDPQNATEPVEYVMSLAQAGLAEMRALIFELRPESLELEGVVAAIEKQIASIEARYKLVVETALGEEPDCSLDAKEALYRIAQEALHNVVKHAHATRVEVRLERRAGDIVLSVRDDGRGFDATASFPGHVGLLSMPERAAKLGGTLTIESGPGEGTRVTATVPG